MPWDLQLSRYSDLLFSPHRDLVTVSGFDLLRQRIFMRLKIHRGRWVFDERGDLGSELDLALQLQKPNSIEAIPALVAEALDPMSEEIQIRDIRVTPSETDSRALTLIVDVIPLLPPEVAASPVFEVESLKISIPLPQLISD